MSRIKIWLETNREWLFLIFTAIILITLSFGAGFLIAKEANPAPIIIEKCSE